MTKKFKKILVLGSGAIKIGEAGEFDYSGSQAMKALKEEGIKSVLVNPNVATVQTSPLLADELYFLPVNEHFVTRVIERERPDGIMLSFGGQTALNCGLKLQASGVLQKYGVEVLGTPVKSVELTEDRQMFADHLKSIGIPVPPSAACTTLAAARTTAKKISFPVMVRAAFALGGQKSGVAHDQKELDEIVAGALAVSPQVLVEKYLHHFKEIEYEVVRDRHGNCVTVCNMENFDPLGIHTGDSIVIAPSQTLTDAEYHGLRAASIKIVQSLGIVGECNVQFALNPKPKNGGLDYYVIEVNARLSRSSALASKATGYPLAYVAAKLALGHGLSEITNKITGVTQSFFEPALDYVVVKMPRWDMEKFSGAAETIGSAMKSVGEVMAIGRSFEEAIQKAVRMQSGQKESVTDNGFADAAELHHYLETPTPKRIFAVAESLMQGVSVEVIHKLTGIDPWFLYRLRRIAEAETAFKAKPILDEANLRALKKLGFSDKKIGSLCGKTEFGIRRLRQDLDIHPWVFQIDTLAGEFPAQTNYLYLTYHGNHHDVVGLGRQATMVLGSGPYHIGSSVEFDWSCVNAALALKRHRQKSIIVNCNPETVSTDYDMSSRLYFEDVSFETVADIGEFEKPFGMVVSVGGQRPNNLAKKLAREGFRLLGTRADDIDRAEDRNRFSALCDELGIVQPSWASFSNVAQAKEFAKSVGYPVLVRPSYVLSGSAMSVCANEAELEAFTKRAAVLGPEHPVTISKFIENAKELEFDGVAQRGQIVVAAISEHVENAGVHSGDATIVYPTQRVFSSTERQLKEISARLAKRLRITGPFNIQFMVKDNQPYMIEVNVRASRTFPLLSKATGINFAQTAVDCFFGTAKPVKEVPAPAVVVKSSQFSFARLAGADPILRVEMSSTGEVACFGDSYDEALLKSILSAVNFDFNRKSVLLSLGGPVNKAKFLEYARLLVDLGYKLFATEHTADFLSERGLACQTARKASERGRTVIDLIETDEVGFVVNVSFRDDTDKDAARKLTDGFRIRRAAVDRNIPLFTDLHLARAFVRALSQNSLDDLAIKPYREYMRAGRK